MPKHYRHIGYLVLAGMVFLLLPFIGPHSVSMADLWNGGLGRELFFNVRLPRVVTASLAGAALALAGMVFQAVFRNGLATPYTLGVSGGASFGAALFLRLSLPFSFLSVSGLTIASFIGALASILLVYGLSRTRGGFGPDRMLLAGIAVSFFFSGMILFVQYFADMSHSYRIVHWLMGSIDSVGWNDTIQLLPALVLGMPASVLMHRELNLLASGEELARSRGLDTEKTRKILFFTTSLMVGGVVSVAGPIAFVGMVAPHICRMLVGSDHKRLAGATVLFGALFLAVCDTIARTIIAPSELPVGVLTALLGGPFFLYLIARGRNL